MEPIPTLDVSEVRFEETVDVVVVGQGVAGASAVMGARQAGADVLAVERSGGPGGTSALSGGLLYLGGGTALQSACGFEDSPANMAAFLRAALGPGADDDRIDAYCEGSPDHFDWLVSIGVPFRASFCDEPNRESADDAGLLFSGGEDSYPFDELAVPVPRGHKPRFVDSAGGFLMGRLGAAVAASGARVVVDAAAGGLVVDDGDVVGLTMRTDDGTRAVRVRGGVVLATGGFIHDEAMVAEHCPLAHVPDPAWRIGTPNDDGRGIRTGVGAGAATTRLDSFECALPLGPPHRLARGILVNRHGERFINEDAYTGRIGIHALRDQDGFVHMITDDVIHDVESDRAPDRLRGRHARGAGHGPRRPAGRPGAHGARVQRGRRPRRGPGLPQAGALPAAHRRAAGERHRSHRSARRPRGHLRDVHARRPRHRPRRRRARRRGTSRPGSVRRRPDRRQPRGPSLRQWHQPR